MMDVSQLVGQESAPEKKRPGRKPKAAVEQATKPKRKYTRRAKVQPAAERAFAIFLGEDDLQLAPAGSKCARPTTSPTAAGRTSRTARRRCSMRSNAQAPITTTTWDET